MLLGMWVGLYAELVYTLYHMRYLRASVRWFQYNKRQYMQVILPKCYITLPKLVCRNNNETACCITILKDVRRTISMLIFS